MLQMFKYSPPETCKDGFDIIKHKLCFNVCMSLFLSMILVIFMNYAFGFLQMMYLQWIVWGIFGALALSFKYHKINRVNTTVILLATGAVFLFIAISVSNTIQSPIMPWFCLIPLYAFWLLNGRHALYWLIISMVIYLVLLYLFFSSYKPASIYDYYSGNNSFYAVFGLILLLINVYIIGYDFEKKKKHAIDEINQTNAELNSALTKLKIAKEELEEAQKHKDIFIAQMSHEMRTPMNAICGVSELLLGRENSIEMNLISILSKSSKQLLNIINDILDISKLQTGKFQVQNISYLLDELVQDVYSYTKTICDEKGIQLHFSVNCVENVFLKGDPYRLNQILHNVLSNAVKFTEKGWVNFEVDFSPEKSMVYFKVSDSGIGMTDDELQKVFIPFSQANNLIHLNYGGTGIGLNISKKLIDLFGGDIKIKSIFGVGTEISITFPVTIADKATESLLKDKYCISTEIKDSLKNLRILLAEDSEVNRIIFTELIKSEIPEIIIETANNGEEVIEKLEMGSFDLVIMDIQMPKRNGLQASRIIRNHPQEKIRKIFIIALSAYARKAEIDECIKAGMNDYLSKPINKYELLLKAYNLVCKNKLPVEDHADWPELSPEN